MPSNAYVYSVEADPAALYVGTTDGLGISVDGGATVAWRRGAEGITGPRGAVHVP